MIVLLGKVPGCLSPCPTTGHQTSGKSKKKRVRGKATEKEGPRKEAGAKRLSVEWGRRMQGEKKEPGGGRELLPRLDGGGVGPAAHPAPLCAQACPCVRRPARRQEAAAEWPLTYADGGHLGRDMGAASRRQTGLAGSLFGCIRLRKARPPSLSKSQFNSNKAGLGLARNAALCGCLPGARRRVPGGA